MLVVLTKLASPQVVGQFALGLAITAPVMTFANLKLQAVQATDAKGEYLFGDYLGLRMITTPLALLVIGAIAVVSGYGRETALILLAVGTAKAFDAISDVFYGLLQRHERMDRIAKSRMIKGLVSLLALGAGVYLTGSVFWGAVGLVVASALVLFGYDVRSGALMLISGPRAVGPVRAEAIRATGLRPHWKTNTLSRLAWLALPLGIVMMLTSLNTSIPRYFVEGYLGEHELGIFAAIAYLKRAGNTFALALGQSASPRLAGYYAAGNGKAFRWLVLKLVGVGALLGAAGVLVAVVAGSEILTLLYQPEYAQHDLLVRVMVATGIGYVASFLGYAMTAARYFRAQLPLFAFVSGTTALACLWLIPSGGLRGAATALIISIVIQAVCSLAVVMYALSVLGRHQREG
jgi:O-antigen/teichoic acid export membrane protein